MAIEAPQPTILETLAGRLRSPERRLLLIRGSLALAFGLLALPWRGMTLLLLLALFNAWMLVAGASALVSALRHRRSMPGRRLTALFGLASLAVGVASLLQPAATLLALALLVGVHGLASGALDVVQAASAGPRRLLLWAGLSSVAFGVVVLAFAQAVLPALVWLIAGYAILHGVLLLLHAFERPATFSSR